MTDPMWNFWLVSTLVAITCASAIAWFTRRWLIVAIAVGIGTPLVLALGDQIANHVHNKYVGLVIFLGSFLTFPAAVAGAYSSFRIRQIRAEKQKS